MNTARLPFDVGQSSAVEELGGGAPEVINLLVDASGANFRRPGRKPFLDVNAPGSGGVIGMTVFQDQLIYVTADRKLWRVHPGAPGTPVAISSADVLTQLDGGKRPTFIDDDVRLMIAGGGSIQQWRPEDLLSKRLSVDSPTSDPALSDPPLAEFLTSIDQVVVSNDTRFPNQFHWSGIGPNSPDVTHPGHAMWPPLNFNTADASPDAVNAVRANSRELFVFGPRTTQAYGIGGDPLLPFVSSATSEIGCIAPYSVTAAEQVFHWLDDRKRFIVSDARSNEVLSDAIASTLRELGLVSDAWGARIDIGSFSLMIWFLPTAKRCFYFDRGRKQWGEWRGWSTTDGDWTGVDIGAYVYWPAIDKHIVGLASGPGLYEMSMDSTTDFDGGPIVAERTTTFVNHGGDGQKGCLRERYILRRGNVAFGDSDVFEVTRRDGLGSWEPWARLSLGDVTDKNPMVEDYPGGVYRERQHRVRYSGPTPFVLVRVEESFETLEAAA